MGSVRGETYRAIGWPQHFGVVPSIRRDSNLCFTMIGWGAWLSVPDRDRSGRLINRRRARLWRSLQRQEALLRPASRLRRKSPY